MFSKFKKHIEEDFPFLMGKKLLVACSGGVDSVVLSYLIKEMNLDFALAHCNFTLRGKDSDADEMFVVGLAKALDISVFAETFQTKAFAKDQRISTQMAARTLRYNWFAEISSNFNFDFILTAHHLDDDMETFFINLSRGTGIQGLTGIPKQNEKVIRPLLPFSRKEIEDYAQRKGLRWREDLSNQKPDYLRNKIRLEVLPSFKETNPSIFKNFQTTQRNLRASSVLVEDYMNLIFKLVIVENNGSYEIDIPKLKEIPHTRELLYELLNGFGFTEWDDVIHLLDSQTGKQLFSATHRLLKNREKLLLTAIDFEEKEEEFYIYEEGMDSPVKLMIETVDAIEGPKANVIYVDADKMSFPLTMRKRNEGDKFHPFGMKGQKKLSKFFKDEKIPQFEKEKTWILLSGQHIMWVMGYRADERFKVDAGTKRIYRITYTE